MIYAVPYKCWDDHQSIVASGELQVESGDGYKEADRLAREQLNKLVETQGYASATYQVLSPTGDARPGGDHNRWGITDGKRKEG